MKRVGAFEAKTHLSQLLSEVEHTHARIIIQRRGKDVAALVPCADMAGGADEDEVRKVIEGLREIRARQRPAAPGESAEDLIEEGRER